MVLSPSRADVRTALKGSALPAALAGDQVQARRWKTGTALELEHSRDPGRPFRWVGIVSSAGVVSEVQSCVRVAAETQGPWRFMARPENRRWTW